MSESMNFGQINISTETTISGSVKDIKTGLTLISNRHFTKKIREKNTNDKFNIKKANCHSLTNITLHKAIKNTGTEKKNRDGLWEALSIEKNSYKLKSNLIRSSAHLENLSESEDMENPEFKW